MSCWSDKELIEWIGIPIDDAGNLYELMTPNILATQMSENPSNSLLYIISIIVSYQYYKLNDEKNVLVNKFNEKFDIIKKAHNILLESNLNLYRIYYDTIISIENKSKEFNMDVHNAINKKIINIFNEITSEPDFF